MRVATLWVLGLFLPGLGCSDDENKGGLQQVQGDTGLLIRDGDVVTPDTRPDTDTDTDTEQDTDADTDTEQDTDTDIEPDTDADTDTTPLECDVDETCPNTACETGRCVDGTCKLVARDDGIPCNDGEVCTTNDQCVAGQCVGSMVACDDGNACTDDTCKLGFGCMFSPKSCDDQNACTLDECKPALGCVSTPITCGPVTNACQRARCDAQVGCLIEPAGQDVSCSDNDACTTGDRCQGTECVGTPIDCDDGNACTADACVSGGCVSTPISGCGTTAECAGKLAGHACNDGNEATTGDMCLLGVCRGFALTRIAGTSVANQQGLVLVETAHGPDGWSAIYWVVDLVLKNRFLLARITDPANPISYAATLQDRLFIGLRDGFVGDTLGRVWRFGAGAWTRTNAWDTALGASGRGSIYDLWTSRDVSAQGVEGTRRLWLVGDDDDEGWLRYCVEQNGGVTCTSQDLDDFDDTAIPQVVAGVPRCTNGACSSSALVLGADLWDDGDFFNDTYENVTGTAPLWTEGRIPDNSSSRTTQGIAVWGPPAALRAVVVGTSGYVSVRRANGTWSNNLTLKEQQSTRTFNGAWQGAGVVALAATRRISSSQIAYELWTAPIEGDLELGATWTVHELGRAQNVNTAGLYDIHIRPNGEARAVGGIRRNGLIDWLDGAVWVRTP